MRKPLVSLPAPHAGTSSTYFRQSERSRVVTAAGPIQAAFILACSALYALVSTRIRATGGPVSPPAARAMRAFRAWWAGIAALFLTAGLSVALTASGPVADGARLALAAVGMIAVCVGVGGLVHYVIFIYAGTERLYRATLVYYLAVAILLLSGIALDPATESARWASSVADLTILTGPIVTLGIAAFLLPAIGACIAYASLYPRLHTRQQRMRVAFTSAAFVAWFGSALVARASGIADAAWWPLLGQAIGVLASVLVVLAYWTPAWLASPAPRRHPPRAPLT